MAIGGDVVLDKVFFGEKCADLGMSGSGKSYGARVVIEEARALGIPVVVIDPQDAHGNYDKLGFDYVHVKDVKDLKRYGTVVANTGQSVVVRTKGLGIEDQQKAVEAFLKGYRLGVRKGIQYVVIDEAHKFAPEHSNPVCKDEVRGMFQENRSDGVGAMAISQRPARLDKTVLSQADHLMLFRVRSAADKAAIKGYLDTPDDIERLPDLPKGTAMLVGFGRDGVDPIAIRKANTVHTGNSPEHIKENRSDIYAAHSLKLVRKRSKVSETIDKNDAISGVVPGMEGALDLAKLGVKVAVGAAATGVVSTLAMRAVPSIGPISNRTLVAATSTVAMYATYRMTARSLPVVSDIAKYGAAGSAAFTLGSLAFDALAAFNVTPPAPVAFAMQVGTGAAPLVMDRSGLDIDGDIANR